MKKKSCMFLSLTVMFFMLLFVLPFNLKTTHAESLSQSDELTYSQTFNINDEASLQTALNSLNSSSAENYYLFNFNITINDTITLNTGYVTLTGSITSASSNPILIISPDGDSDYILSDLTINGSNKNLIEAENNFNLTIDNCTFENYYKTESYAIKFNNATTINLSLAGNISNECAYLYNHVNGLSTTIEEELTNTVALDFSFPYELTNQIVIRNYNLAPNKIRPVSTNENIYEVESFVNESMLISSSRISIVFDDNESETNNITLTDFEYNSISVEFPSSDEISKSHFTFGGWFGKITIEENTYYFDQEILENYLNSNDISDLKTSLDELSDNKSFTEYSNNLDNSTFKAVNLFLAQNQVPTFIAKWNDIVYTISFETNGGSEVESVNKVFGDDISNLSVPTKQGHTFAGWFTDAELKNEFELSSMPAENIKLYAKWNAHSYEISFITNKDFEIDSKFYNYEDDIDLPTPLATGYTFDGWFEDEELNSQFTLTKMPNRNVTLYAKWIVNSYTLTFNNDGAIYHQVTKNYNEDISNVASLLQNPTKTGYTFRFWYSLSNSNVSYSFDKMPDSNLTVYAKWQINSHTITFITNSTQSINSVTLNFGQTITLPSLTKVGSRFVGWFTDSACTKKLTSYLMPDNNITLYAGWANKLVININEDAQTYNINSENNEFANFSDIDGFTVQYLVDGEWSIYIPTKIGKYDVLVTRAEDNDYSAFAKVIHNGFILDYEIVSYTWLYVLLFVVAGAEILVIILLRVMKSMKANLAMSVTFTPLLSMFLDTNKGIFVINGSQAITMTSFILILISGILALAGFVVMIYSIVKLHRVAPVIIYQNADSETNNGLETPRSAEAIQKVHNDSLDKQEENIKSKVDEYLQGIDISEIEPLQNNSSNEEMSDNDFTRPTFNVPEEQVIDDFDDDDFDEDYEEDDDEDKF